MANEINESIYTSLYSYKANNNDLFTITGSLQANLIADQNWNSGLRDSSNVYTTFNPSQFPTLSTVTNFNVDYEQAEDDPTTDQTNVKTFTTTNSQPNSTNLRYCITLNNFSSNGTGHGYKWSNFTEQDSKEKLLMLLSGQNVSTYKDLNYKHYWGSASTEIFDTYLSLNPSDFIYDSPQEYYVNSIERSNLFIVVTPGFSYINDSGAIVLYGTVPQEVLLEWLKNDTTGFLEYDGKKLFVSSREATLFVKSSDGNSFVAVNGFSYTNLVTSETHNEAIGTFGNIWVQVENYINGNLYYYSIPLIQPTQGISFPYARGWYNNINVSFPSYQNSYGNFGFTSTNPLTCLNNMSFTNSTGQLPDFNEGIMLLPFEEFDSYQIAADDFFTNAGGSGTSTTAYKYYGRTILGRVDVGRNRGNEMCVQFYNYCISGKELMALYSLFLIPFYINTQNNLQFSINQDSDPDSMFVGIREENGTVIGNYEPYIWGETEVEDDLRPEDFEPIDPTKEPEKPDEPDSGDIGANPNASNYGDSIGFNPDGILPYDGVDSTKAYLVNKATLTEMFANLWNSPESFWDALSMNKSNSANVFDYLINIKAYPFPITGGNPTKTIYLGAGAELTVSATDGFYTPSLVVKELNFGGISITSDFAKSFLGKQPYSKLYVHLPYSGTWEIDPKLASGSYADGMVSIYVEGFLDIRTGTIVYYVYRYDSSVDTSTPLLIKSANVGMDVPISGADLTTQSSNIINATLSTTRTVAGVATKAFGTLAKGAMGNYGGAAMDLISSSPVQTATDLVGSVANLAAASREIPQLSGGTTGASAPVVDSYCYFILQEPIVANPKNFNHTYGRMCNLQLNIGSYCSGRGFTQCSNVDCSNIANASEEEKAEIKRLMENGIYC